ncbi:MAG TPA: hypothetical protein VLJ17_14575 [Xanthobacteraceae bacterium]|nr:hypothetical protein [Xanthobacteraceae bacterium]
MSDIDVQRFSEIATVLAVICIPTFIVCRYLYTAYRTTRNMVTYGLPRSDMRPRGFNPIAAGAFLLASDAKRLFRWLLQLPSGNARKRGRQMIARGPQRGH